MHLRTAYSYVRPPSQTRSKRLGPRSFVHAVLLEVVDGPQLVTLLDSEPSDRQPRLMLRKDVLDCVGAIEPALFCSLFSRDCK